MPKDDHEVLTVAIRECECETQTMKLEELRTIVYKKLRVAVDEDQWDRVYVMFHDAGGKVRRVNDIMVIRECPPKTEGLELEGRALGTPQQTRRAAAAAAVAEKMPWPPTEPERAKAVWTALIVHGEPATTADIQGRFVRVGEEKIEVILDTLVALDLAKFTKNGKYKV